MPNFSDILDQPASTIERPKPVPVGTYIALVRGLPEYLESSKKKTPFARFVLELLQAEDDVDAEDLEAMGGLSGKTLRHDLYLTEDALWRAKDFAEQCGVEVDDSTSRREMLEACNGAQIRVEVRHEPAQDGSEQVYARVGKVTQA